VGDASRHRNSSCQSPWSTSSSTRHADPMSTGWSIADGSTTLLPGLVVTGAGTVVVAGGAAGGSAVVPLDGADESGGEAAVGVPGWQAARKTSPSSTSGIVQSCLCFISASSTGLHPH